MICPSDVTVAQHGGSLRGWQDVRQVIESPHMKKEPQPVVINRPMLLVDLSDIKWPRVSIGHVDKIANV